MRESHVAESEISDTSLLGLGHILHPPKAQDALKQRSFEVITCSLLKVTLEALFFQSNVHVENYGR